VLSHFSFIVTLYHTIQFIEYRSSNKRACSNKTAEQQTIMDVKFDH